MIFLFWYCHSNRFDSCYIVAFFGSRWSFKFKLCDSYFVTTATLANHMSHKLSSWYLCWWTSSPQRYHLSSSLCFDSDMGGEN